jgi:hypothetical protein
VSSLRALLMNPIYKGDYVWNRSEWIKDHETGRRRRHERAPEEWVRQHDESLAIVAPALWDRVQSIRQERGRGYEWHPGGGFKATRARAGHRVRSKHLLSGLLACSECGAAFFAVTGGERYGCGWHRDRGPDVCGNALRVSRLDLEERVLSAVRERVLTPENVAYAVERALQLVREHATPADHAGARRRLAEIEVEIGRAARLAVKTGDLDAVTAILAELRQEREEIQRRLAAAPIIVDLERLRPRAEAMVREIRQRTADGDVDTRRRALRSLIEGRLRVSPDPSRGFCVDGLVVLDLGGDSLARCPSDLG